MTPTLSTFVGRDMLPLLPDVASLCTVVFREWPHLYEGDGRYDTSHLRTLAESRSAALVMAYNNNVPIGASTCLPLADATANVQAPFLARGWPPERFFYFAESVLLPAYRGRGVGAAFFALREAHVRARSECDHVCFCAVERPTHHPARPFDARSLEGLWRGLGYKPVPGLRCTMTWREIGQAKDSEVSLAFWMKRLVPEPTDQFHRALDHYLEPGQVRGQRARVAPRRSGFGPGS